MCKIHGFILKSFSMAFVKNKLKKDLFIVSETFLIVNSKEKQNQNIVNKWKKLYNFIKPRI